MRQGGRRNRPAWPSLTRSSTLVPSACHFARASCVIGITIRPIRPAPIPVRVRIPAQAQLLWRGRFLRGLRFLGRRGFFCGRRFLGGGRGFPGRRRFLRGRGFVAGGRFLGRRFVGRGRFRGRVRLWRLRRWLKRFRGSCRRGFLGGVRVRSCCARCLDGFTGEGLRGDLGEHAGQCHRAGDQPAVGGAQSAQCRVSGVCRSMWHG